MRGLVALWAQEHHLTSDVAWDTTVFWNTDLTSALAASYSISVRRVPSAAHYA